MTTPGKATSAIGCEAITPVARGILPEGESFNQARLDLTEEHGDLLSLFRTRVAWKISSSSSWIAVTEGFWITLPATMT